MINLLSFSKICYYEFRCIQVQMSRSIQVHVVYLYKYISVCIQVQKYTCIQVHVDKIVILGFLMFKILSKVV